MNPRCNSSADLTVCQNNGIYYPNKSNSSTYVGGNFAVTYGTGAVKGSYWADIINIASKHNTTPRLPSCCIPRCDGKLTKRV